LRLWSDAERAPRMERVSGDLKELTVTWSFEDLGGRLTQANFALEFAYSRGEEPTGRAAASRCRAATRLGSGSSNLVQV
jgi:hypothetical protein